MHPLFKRGLALAAAFAMALPGSMPTAALAATTAETLGAATTIEDGASYRLVSAVNPKLAATVISSTLLPEKRIVNEVNGKQEAHIFITEQNSDGTYKLITQLSDMAVEVKDGSSKNSARVQTAYENDSRQQDWELIPHSDGSYTVKNAASGTVLDVAGGSKSSGTTIHAYAQNNTAAQRFYFVKTAARAHTYSGFYTIRSAKDKNFVLDIAGGSMDNKANIQLYKRNDTAAQTFRILYSGNGYYRIQGVKSFGVLDVKSYSTADGANVQQYQWTGGSNQLWKIVDNGDGTVTFLNKKSGKALDVSGGLMQNGRNIQQYRSNGTPAQKWTLKKRSRIIYTARTPQTKTKVYVNAASVPVYKTKNTGSTVVSTAYYGENMTAIGDADANGWRKVITTGGKTGYVKGTVIQSSRPANRNISNGYPLYYGDNTMNVTVLKEQIAGTWVYAAHVQMTDYNRFKGAYPAGAFSYKEPASETVLSAANRLGAVLAINGDAATLLTAVKERAGRSIRNGEVRAYTDSAYVHRHGLIHAAYSPKTGIFSNISAFGLTKDATPQQILNAGITESFVFWGEEQGWLYQGVNKQDPGSTGRAQRTFIGSNEKPGDLWLCVSGGRGWDGQGLTGYEMMEYLRSKGCTYGYGLDGGSSSAMVFRGSILNPQQVDGGRAVWDFLYVK